MNSEQACILTINGGSSSIKFALYNAEELPLRLLQGKIDRIGLKDSTLTFNNEKGAQKNTINVEAPDHHFTINFLMDWLEKQEGFSSVKAIGHRVVHGMYHTRPELITSKMLDELNRIAPYDPDHLPAEIELIEVFRKRHPKLPQIACFDTAFKGKSIDTSMGFTPGGGFMMGTRPGDLDPGVAWYIIKSENSTPKQFNNLINHESGLLGVSETSFDMQDLLVLENNDIRAVEAVSLFCYQAKKWIGSFAAALGGLNALVFSGGIGENSPKIRTRICEGLGFLGIELEEKRNNANAMLKSADNGKVAVRVIRTDEELMKAKTVSQMINII